MNARSSPAVCAFCPPPRGGETPHSRRGGVPPPWPMRRARTAVWRPSSCTSHGLWARCPLSVKGALKEWWRPRRHGPCAEQRQSSGGLFLLISWAVGKMPTLLEGDTRQQAGLATQWRASALKEWWRPRRHGPCAEQGQSSGGPFLLISWAVGKMPTLLEGDTRQQAGRHFLAWLPLCLIEPYWASCP